MNEIQLKICESQLVGQCAYPVNAELYYHLTDQNFYLKVDQENRSEFFYGNIKPFDNGGNAIVFSSKTRTIYGEKMIAIGNALLRNGKLYCKIKSMNLSFYLKVESNSYYFSALVFNDHRSGSSAINNTQKNQHPYINTRDDYEDDFTDADLARLRGEFKVKPIYESKNNNQYRRVEVSANHPRREFSQANLGKIAPIAPRSVHQSDGPILARNRLFGSKRPKFDQYATARPMQPLTHR